MKNDKEFSVTFPLNSISVCLQGLEGELVSIRCCCCPSLSSGALLHEHFADVVKAVLSCTCEKLHLLVSCREGIF